MQHDWVIVKTFEKRVSEVVCEVVCEVVHFHISEPKVEGSPFPLDGCHIAKRVRDKSVNSMVGSGLRSIDPRPKEARAGTKLNEVAGSHDQDRVRRCVLSLSASRAKRSFV